MKTLTKSLIIFLAIFYAFQVHAIRVDYDGGGKICWVYFEDNAGKSEDWTKGEVSQTESGKICCRVGNNCYNKSSLKGGGKVNFGPRGIQNNRQ
jgi:hypothetical protein